jgi:hypothetical protein
MAQPYISWTDVRSVLASVDAFDLKINLNEERFVDATTDTLTDSGYIGRLYRDGVDLGAAQANVGAVDADGEWFYNSASDLLTTFNTNASDTYEWQTAPDTLANIQAKFMNTGAEMFESILDPRYPRPFPKSTRTYSGDSYEAPLKKGVALFAAREAILTSDPGNPEILKIETQLWNEEETGLIDLIKKGELKFEFEKTDSDEHGEIVEGSLNASTTGYPVETYGDASVAYAKVKVQIGTGGTIIYGTANTTIDYTVVDGDGASIVESTILDITDIQTIGYGVSVSWAEGVYTADDYWYIYIRQHSTTSSIISSFDLSRV